MAEVAGTRHCGGGRCEAVKKRAAGSAGAILQGAAMPVFFLLCGELVNGFGRNQHDLQRMTDEYSLYFLYLGLAVCASSCLAIACWIYTGALRRRYREAVLRQDVGFFDTDARTGDVVFSVSTDTLLVQDAIGEKVGNFICYVATFLVVGFVSAWRLVLLSAAFIRGIAIAGGPKIILLIFRLIFAQYSPYFLYLGLVVCASSCLEIACWIYTGQRQAGALRRRYLEAVLRQDVGFIDTDARTGDVVFSVSTDTHLVQDAIGEKVGKFIHYVATFLVVGFVSASSINIGGAVMNHNLKLFRALLIFLVAFTLNFSQAMAIVPDHDHDHFDVKGLEIAAVIIVAVIVFAAILALLHRLYRFTTLEIALRRRQIPFARYPPKGAAYPAGDVHAMCAVCISDYRSRDHIAVLPGCGHIFHRRCMRKEVVREYPRCPLCRAAIP